MKALMSFGHPGESEETVHATRDWLLAEKPDDLDVTVITVYPGTPYYDRAMHVEGKVWKYEHAGDVLFSLDVDFTRDAAYYKGVPGDYRAFVWTPELTAEELVHMRDAVEAEVRHKLRIPYPGTGAVVEKSMGQHI